MDEGGSREAARPPCHLAGWRLVDVGIGEIFVVQLVVLPLRL
jgi:hypothetical protein